MPETTSREEPFQLPRQQDSEHPSTDPSALARLLDDWMRGDEAEQRETFEILRRALDEDRPASYKLFP